MSLSFQISVLHAGNKFHMPVHPVSDPPDNFSHGKSSKNGSDPQPLYMAQEGPGHKDGQGQTRHIKADFYSGIGKSCNLRKFPWKKIRRYNGHLTPVCQRMPKQISR